MNDKPILQGEKSGSGGSAPTIEPDSLISDDFVEFTMGICEGPIAGLADGPKSFYLDDTPLVSQTDDLNFNPFILQLWHGEQDATPVSNIMGGVSSNATVGVELAEATPVVRTTTSALRGLIDQLEVRIQVNQLLLTNEGGDQLENTVEFSIEYRESGAPTWQSVYDDGIVSLTGKTTSGYVRDFVIQVPRVENDWEIRLTKISPDNEEFNTRRISWESYQMVTREDRSYDNLAVIRGYGQASDQFSSIPTFSGVYSAKIIKVPTNYDPITRYYLGVWDGTFKDAHTDNPAWILYDLLTNDVYGFKRYYPRLLADRFSFYDAAKWCDELVPRSAGGYQPRWTYNDRIDQPRNGIELLYYIAGSFGAIPVEDLNGTVRLKVDKPEVPVQLFGPESVTADGFNYQFTAIEQRPNDITVKFINPNLDWDEDARRVFDQGAIDKNGRIHEELVAIGCNDVHEAQRRAYRRLVQANTETVTVSFKTARAGIQLEPFDVIGVVDPTMNWGISGRVKSVSGTVIELRDSIFVSTNTDLTLTVQTLNGPEEITVQSVQPSTKQLFITAGTWPPRSPEFAQFALTSSEVGLVKPFRILRIEEDVEQKELVQITALEVNVNKYGDIDTLSSSGTIDYSFRRPERPRAPVITNVESGTAQLFITPSGVIRPRVLLEWEQDPRSFATEFEISYAIRDTGDWQQKRVVGRSTHLLDLIEGKIYDIYIKALNVLGRSGDPSETVSHTVIGKLAPPSDVSNVSVQQRNAEMWVTFDQISDLDVFYYEIRRGLPGSDWETADLLGSTQSGRFIDNSVLPPEVVYFVKAVDTLGNYSVNAAKLAYTPTRPQSPYATLSFQDENFSITIVPSGTESQNIVEYVVMDGSTEIHRSGSPVFTDRANWSGTKMFNVKVVSDSGQPSPDVEISGTVIAAPAPSITSKVIDNNVLLRWSSSPGTLPILKTEIRRGTNFASAEVLQSADATFATFFEEQAGNYTYWLVSVDSAGNYGTPSARTVSVDTPPDFVLRAENESDLSGTTVNVLNYEGALYFGFNDVETFEEHFINQAITTPQQQIDAGYPVYLQPNLDPAVAIYQETIDYGIVIDNSIITVEPTTELITGNATLSVRIEVRETTGDAWTVFENTSKAFAQNFRYARITLTVDYTDRTGILRLTSLITKLSQKLRTDAGSSTASAADASGTTVNFGIGFLDVTSIVVTAAGTSPVTAIYDFTDTPNPTSFAVYLFDETGSRISGDFSWTARGY